MGTRTQICGIGVLAAIIAATAGIGGGSSAALVERAQDSRCRAALVRLDAGAVLGGTSPEFCLPIATGNVGKSRIDPVYGQVATALAGFVSGRDLRARPRHALVVCWSRPDWQALAAAFRAAGIPSFSRWAGYVEGRRRVVNLSPSVCEQLDRIAFGHERPRTTAAATALDVLAHETMHASGIRSEGIAECYAMQLTEMVGRRLGAPDGYGRDLGALRFADYDTAYGRTVYQNGGCAAGLRYDLGLEPSIWSRVSASSRP